MRSCRAHRLDHRSPITADFHLAYQPFDDHTTCSSSVYPSTAWSIACPQPLRLSRKRQVRSGSQTLTRSAVIGDSHCARRVKRRLESDISAEDSESCERNMLVMDKIVIRHGTTIRQYSRKWALPSFTHQDWPGPSLKWQDFCPVTSFQSGA